jgi:hypothetical protein
MGKLLISPLRFLFSSPIFLCRPKRGRSNCRRSPRNHVATATYTLFPPHWKSLMAARGIRLLPGS